MEEVQQDTSMEEEDQNVSMEEISPKSMPPKMRIKLSLRMPPKSPETVKSTIKVDSTSPPSEMQGDATFIGQKPAAENGAVQDTSPSSGKKNGQATLNLKTEDSLPANKPENVHMKDTTPSNQKNGDKEAEEVVQATVVNTSDEGDDGIDAKVKVEPVKSTKTPTARSSTQKKRTSSKPSLPVNARGIRLPPLSSPGLLIPPSAGVFRGDADANGYTTPSSVFDHCMVLGGYTTEARTENPHRGSSVRRQVGDLFDSDVTFALNFPPLVPTELWSLPKEKSPEAPNESGPDAEKKEDAPTGADASKEEKKEEGNQRDAAQLLLRSLAPLGETKENGQTSSTPETSRKRRRPWQFSEMAPVSLTLPYPESYIQKRLRYVEKVQERERAIVVSQEAKQKYEDAQERYTLIANAKRTTEALPPEPVRPKPTVIPPIPEPVSPPRASEMEGSEFNGLDDSNHPIYLPKTHDKHTAHLDPACFGITEGRYFNLMTNSIADPNFVGPNAPGIAGLNLAGGSGLATAYSGSTSTSVSALNAAYYGSTNTGNSAAGGSATKSAPTKSSSKKKSSSSGSTSAAAKSTTDSASVPDDALFSGQTPTSTSSELKKLMDEGGDDAIAMKNAIIRAAVYASRKNRHTMSWMGSNGEVYPDVSKAFAAHGGVRPCNRCKNNKQGAYHCRLRRKHKDLDYDGGNSPEKLAPLFQVPLDDLLLGNK